MNFRGICIDTDIWKQGHGMSHVQDLAHVICETKHNLMHHAQVKPETLGFSLGWLDQDEKIIFTGDILQERVTKELMVVELDRGQIFLRYAENRSWSISDPVWNMFKVVGNIFEHLELIEWL